MPFGKAVSGLIASSFQDLQNALKQPSHARLRADCLPAGMELFPAVDKEQSGFFKQMIEQSACYIFVPAGRYGSIHPQSRLNYVETD